MTEKDILKLPEFEGVALSLDDLVNSGDERLKTQILIREGEIAAGGETRYVAMIGTTMNGRPEAVLLVKKSKGKDAWSSSFMICGDDLKLMAFSLYGVKE